VTLKWFRGRIAEGQATGEDQRCLGEADSAGVGSEEPRSCAPHSTVVFGARPLQLVDGVRHVGRRDGTASHFGGDNGDVHWCSTWSLNVWFSLGVRFAWPARLVTPGRERSRGRCRRSSA
jgi:hypothetical protein